jgi:hypothetical protein
MVMYHPLQWSLTLHFMQIMYLLVSYWVHVYFKSCPTTCHGGPWGERCSSYSFSTSALNGGEWSASHPGRTLAPGKRPLVPIVQEAGWAPELVWTHARGKILVPLPGIEPRSPGHPACSQTLSYPAHHECTRPQI